MEEYNSDIHCCREWYKDYCSCISELLKKAKKKQRDRNVNGTITFLKKNNINYTKSKIPNVIIIGKNNYIIYVSLKKENNLIKCRFHRSNIWYQYSKEKFLTLLSKQNGKTS